MTEAHLKTAHSGWECTSGALSHISHLNDDWHAINWQKVNGDVRRLQARIVKAQKKGRHSKVKILQRLLTRSFSGKALAVRRVTENSGKKTPGVDWQLWDTPDKKMEAVHQMKQRGYRPLPLRRVNIPKPNGTTRPLGIPTMKDRAMQALYLLALDPVAECRADAHSYGFRKGRSCADALAYAHTIFAIPNAAEWVLEGDIKGCFDNISHEWLLAYVPLEHAILHKWLKAGYIEKNVFSETTEGTPQGGIISPVLANLALDGLETILRQRYPKKGKPLTNQKVNLVRYADDFIITGKSKDVLEGEVRPLVEQFMAQRGLELSPAKTVITHIEEGFDFLGQTVRRYASGKVLTTPSKKNVKAFLKGIREFLKHNQTANTYWLVLQLNLKIRGWANYHRHAVSQRIFSDVDSHIFEALWAWAKRRHSNKNKQWIARKYFGQNGLRRWRFFGQATDESGQTVTNWLCSAASTPIRRHTKIKAEANPYDPEWELYFEERLGLKMAATLRGRRTLSHLWKEQRGFCPVCRNLITKVTGWHNHHITWRSLGGCDKLENRVLIHPECHRQLHVKGVSVSKPRPLGAFAKA